MAQAPNLLQPDTPYPETVALLNDNFQKIVSDVGDIGSKFSGGISSSTTLASGAKTIIPIGVTDSRHQYVAGEVQVVPRLDVYVDSDANSSYLLGYSNSQNNTCLAVPNIGRSPSVGVIADILLFLWNFDTVSHTYFWYLDLSYQSSPPTGNFR